MRNAWQFSELLTSQFILPVPAQMRKGVQWYQGTSDAIHQNIHLIELSQPEMVAIFGADHIYFMDLRQMIATPGQGCQGTVRGPADTGFGAERFGTMETTVTGASSGSTRKSARPKSPVGGMVPRLHWGTTSSTRKCCPGTM